MIELSPIKSFSIDKRDWEKVKFGEIAFEPKESVKNPAIESIEHVVGLEHIDTEDVRLRRSASIEESTTFTKKFSTGDVLFGRRRAYLKKAAKADFEGICSGDITVMRPKDKLLADLLPFVVCNDKFFDFAVTHSAGGLSPRVKFKDLVGYEFLLPPEDVQIDFVELFSVLNKHLENQKINLEAIYNCQRSYWNEIRNKSELVQVKSVAKISNGTTPSTENDVFWKGGTIPWLPTGSAHDKFISKSDRFITQAAVDQKKSRIFPKNSTLVAMIGQGKTRGSSAMLNIDAAINQNFACVTPIKIDPTFLFYALFFSYQRLRNISQGTNQLALNCELVGIFKIPYVEEGMQKRIASTLSEFDKAIKSQVDAIVKSKKLLKSVINEIF